MSFLDPGRLPHRQLIRDAHLAEQRAELRAEQRARMFPDGEPLHGRRRLRLRLRLRRLRRDT